MKKKRILWWGLMILLILASCGRTSGNKSSESIQSSNTVTHEKMDRTAEVAESDQKAADSKESGTGNEAQPLDSGRKLIKRQDYSVETKEFDKFVQELEQLVSSSGGYMEYSDVSGNNYGSRGGRSASYTLRIPAANLNDFKSEIGKFSNVVRSSEQVEDVTLSYVDTESRIAALKLEQESLMQILEKAEDLETIFAVQEQLTEVRYQLESYESKLRVYDNEVEYSIVTLSVREVERETTVSKSFSDQLKERFLGSLYGLQDGFYSLALFVLGGIPYWILLAVIAVILLLIVRKIKKSRSFSAKNVEKSKIENPTKSTGQTTQIHIGEEEQKPEETKVEHKE